MSMAGQEIRRSIRLADQRLRMRAIEGSGKEKIMRLILEILVCIYINRSLLMTISKKNSFMLIESSTRRS